MSILLCSPLQSLTLSGHAHCHVDNTDDFLGYNTELPVLEISVGIWHCLFC